MNTVYFHGIPGSPAEVELAGVGDAVSASRVYAPNRTAEHLSLSMAEYEDKLVADILHRFPSGPLKLIGFSLGAKVALSVAVRLGDRVARIHLVSPAAPLEGGDFLWHMAGAPVFALAKYCPWLLTPLVWVQGLLARFAPGFLFRALFASAAGADTELARAPAFQSAMRSILAASLTGTCWGYRREVLSYVCPWAALLPCVRHRVHIWHGSRDTWAPPALAEFLARSIPGPQLEGHRGEAPLRHMYPGLSHYSTLVKALPSILSWRSDANDNDASVVGCLRGARRMPHACTASAAAAVLQRLHAVSECRPVAGRIDRSRMQEQ